MYTLHCDSFGFKYHMRNPLTEFADEWRVHDLT